MQRRKAAVANLLGNGIKSIPIFASKIPNSLLHLACLEGSSELSKRPDEYEVFDELEVK